MRVGSEISNDKLQPIGQVPRRGLACCCIEVRRRRINERRGLNAAGEELEIEDADTGTDVEQ